MEKKYSELIQRLYKLTKERNGVKQVQKTNICWN